MQIVCTPPLYGDTPQNLTLIRSHISLEQFVSPVLFWSLTTFFKVHNHFPHFSRTVHALIGIPLQGIAKRPH